MLDGHRLHPLPLHVSRRYVTFDQVVPFRLYQLNFSLITVRQTYWRGAIDRHLPTSASLSSQDAALQGSFQLASLNVISTENELY